MGDKDERGTALSVNVERGAGIFCKIVIVCFLSVRYRSDGLYYKMEGTPSSPTRFFIRVESRNRDISLCENKFKYERLIGVRGLLPGARDTVGWSHSSSSVEYY